MQLFERPFKIVGVYEPPGGGRIKIPLATMQDQEGADGHASAILVAVTDPAQQEEVAARIRERFPDDQIIFTRDLPEIYASGVPALNVFIKVVVGVAAAISMLVILLAMYTTVTERTRQIGILKALGMSKTGDRLGDRKGSNACQCAGSCSRSLTDSRRALRCDASDEPDNRDRATLDSDFASGRTRRRQHRRSYPALRAARQDAVDALSYE